MTTVSKEQCIISPNFENYPSFINEYSKNQELTDLLVKQELDRYLLRKYTSENLSLYVILGTILLDKMIAENAEEELFAQVKKAVTQTQKAFKDINLKTVEMNYQKLLEALKNDKEAILRESNGNIEKAFPKLYERIVKNPNYSTAIAQSMRALLIQEITNRSLHTPELGHILEEITRKFPELSADLYPPILEIFASMFPIRIDYILMQQWKRKWVDKDFVFYRDEASSGFPVKIVEIRCGKNSHALVCYKPFVSKDSALNGFVDREESVESHLMNGNGEHVKSNGLISKKKSEEQGNYGHEEEIKTSKNGVKGIQHHSKGFEEETKNDFPPLGENGNQMEPAKPNYCVNCKSPHPGDHIFTKLLCKHGHCAECLLYIYPCLPLTCRNEPACNCDIPRKEVEAFYRNFLKRYHSSPLAPQIHEILNPVDFVSNSQPNHSESFSAHITHNQAPPMPNDETLVECDSCRVYLAPDVIFKNKCNHTICIYCVQERNWSIAVKCFFKGCLAELKKRELEEFVIAKGDPNHKPTLNSDPAFAPTNGSDTSFAPSKKDMVTCSLCNRSMVHTKVFKNSSCGHFYCTDCISYDDLEHKTYCPQKNCYSTINRSAMKNFVTMVAKEEMVVMTTTVACFACNENTELSYTKNSKPTYFKCLKCNQVNCLTHRGAMKECYCYCPGCSGNLKIDLKKNTKSCINCKQYLCGTCKKELEADKTCGCTCRVCLEKNEDKTSMICVTCREDPKVCPECLEELNEYTRFAMKCKHVICKACRLESFDAADRDRTYHRNEMNGETKNKQLPEKCSICDLLAKFIESEISEQA